MGELLTLPSELLTQIMAHLDITGISRLRQTSHRLCAISQARQLWVWLYQRYLADNPWARTLEEPIEAYNVQELSTIITDWHTVDMGWEKGISFDQSSMRRAELPEGTRNLCLLPGGRWLLVAGIIAPNTGNYAVYVYDLEQPLLSRKLLVTPQCKCDLTLHGTTSMDPVFLKAVLFESEESGPLSFLLAFTHGRNRQCTAPLTVWRVNLEGHGLDAYLKPMSTIVPLATDSGMIKDVSFGERLASVTLFWFPDGFADTINQRIGLYGTEDNRDGSDFESVLSISVKGSMDCTVEESHVLPGPRLLLVYRSRTELYDISEALEAASKDSQERCVELSSLKLISCDNNAGRVISLRTSNMPLYTELSTGTTTVHMNTFDLCGLGARLTVTPSNIQCESLRDRGREILQHCFGADMKTRFWEIGVKFGVAQVFQDYENLPSALMMHWGGFDNGSYKAMALPDDMKMRFNAIQMDEQSGRVVLQLPGRRLFVFETALSRRLSAFTTS